MPRPSITRAWDAFWDRTQYVGLHHLGCQVEPTEEEKAFIAAASDLQQAGALTIRQIYAVTDLVEQAAKIGRGAA